MSARPRGGEGHDRADGRLGLSDGHASVEWGEPLTDDECDRIEDLAHELLDLWGVPRETPA